MLGILGKWSLQAIIITAPAALRKLANSDEAKVTHTSRVTRSPFLNVHMCTDKRLPRASYSGNCGIFLLWMPNAVFAH